MHNSTLEFDARPEGFEPPTPGFEGRTAQLLTTSAAERLLPPTSAKRALEGAGFALASAAHRFVSPILAPIWPPIATVR